MAKYCTNCGKELDENAALCLNCGVLVENVNNDQSKKKKKGLPTWAIILIILGSVLLLPIIALVGFLIFTFNTVNNFVENPDTNMWQEETMIKEGAIGDTIETENFRITLTDALIYDKIGTEGGLVDIPEEGKEYLVFFFDIENISDKSEYISDFDFTGYVDNYEIEVEYLFNDIDGIGDLDATLNPYKKTKGYVAFEVEEDWKKFEIKYSNWFDNTEIIFKVVNKNNSNIQGA